MGAPNLIAENMDCGLSYSVISYLKKLSQQVKSHWISNNSNFKYVSTILTANVSRWVTSELVVERVILNQRDANVSNHFV